jgi:hypothetical protein
VVELRSVEADSFECCPRCAVRCRYARSVADRIGLRDWTVEVAHDPLEDGEAIAQVALHAERKQLRIRYSADFDRQDEVDQRHAVAHELVHAHFRDLFETVKSTAAEELSGTAYRVFVGQVRRDIERAVDGVAAATAQAVPFPSELQS